MVFSLSNSEAVKITVVAGCSLGSYKVVRGKSDCLFIKTGLFNKYIAELSLLYDNQDEQGQKLSECAILFTAKSFRGEHIFEIVSHFYAVQITITTFLPVFQ